MARRTLPACCFVALLAEEIIHSPRDPSLPSVLARHRWARRSPTGPPASPLSSANLGRAPERRPSWQFLGSLTWARQPLQTVKRKKWFLAWFRGHVEYSEVQNLDKRTMASFAARPSRPWSVEEAAVFAARKEFELLKLLATDRKALATARRLGAFRSYTHSQPPTAAVSGSGASASRTGDATSHQRGEVNPARRSAARHAPPPAREGKQPQPHG